MLGKSNHGWWTKVLIQWIRMRVEGWQMTLEEAVVGEEYIIKGILTDDEELNSFLFSLGCYSGEPITVVSRLKGSCVVSIKDARYNINNDLAQAISI